MHVDVRCYAAVREAVGSRRLALALDEGATVDDVVETLAADHADFDRLAGGDAALVVMRDRTHLDRDATLDDGDVLRVSTPPMPE